MAGEGRGGANSCCSGRCKGHTAAVAAQRPHHLITPPRPLPTTTPNNRQGGYASLVAAARYPSLVRGLMLLNSAGPLADPADDDPARDAALLGDADGAAAAAAAVPFWRPAADAVTDAAKRVVLFFAFQRARQPERIREGERAAGGGGGGEGLWRMRSRCRRRCRHHHNTTNNTRCSQSPTHTQHHTTTTPPTNTQPRVLSPSVLEMVYTNASSIDDDLVESIR